MIDPAKAVLPEAPPPPVVIEQITTEQETITEPQERPQPIRLPPGRTKLEFRYSALGFRAPEENRYRYQLEGLDATWVEGDKQQIARYNNVYPGSYTLRVIACNSDGAWNEEGAEVAVILEPYFWQRWWFRPALLALGMGAAGFILRAMSLRRREIESLRIRIAADLHDEIGSNLASIALLSQTSGNGHDRNSHSDLSDIHRIALKTVTATRDAVWFINPDYDTIPEMVLRMRDVAAQMLVGLDYTFDSPPDLDGGKLSPEVRRNVFLIFKEILHNIVKHADASRVEIKLSENRGRLLLQVRDNGRGFATVVASRGNGLRNLRLRAERLSGTVAFDHAKPSGTIVNVAVKIT